MNKMIEISIYLAFNDEISTYMIANSLHSSKHLTPSRHNSSKSYSKSEKKNK